MSSTYHCNICVKNYKSYHSLWKHNKQFHKPTPNDNTSDIRIKNDVHTSDIRIVSPDDFQKKFHCKYCNNIYKHSQSKWNHEQKCKKINEQKTDVLIEQNNNLMKEVADLKELIKEMLNKNNKVHHKTFEKMVNNGTVITDSNVNNGTINNINIIALGNENLEQTLTETEKLNILRHKNALNYIIEYIHFNDKFPQFQNIIVTNNRADEAYIYDIKLNAFKMVQKNTIIDDLINYRVCDIEDFYYELEDKLDDKTKLIIQKLNKDRGDDDNTKNDVKMLLFNNKNKVKHLLK